MSFHDQLLLAIDGWSSDPIQDEWLFEKFRDQFVEKMSCCEAFEAIGKTIDVLLIQADESTAIEVLQTLIALARQSNTTEIPPTLFSQKDALFGQFSAFGDYANDKLRELFRIYRLSYS